MSLIEGDCLSDINLRKHNIRASTLGITISLLNWDLWGFLQVVRVDYHLRSNNWTTCDLQQPSF
jgi:hypothetical protein